jgi:hypothetical protein
MRRMETQARVQGRAELGERIHKYVKMMLDYRTVIIVLALASDTVRDHPLWRAAYERALQWWRGVQAEWEQILEEHRRLLEEDHA